MLNGPPVSHPSDPWNKRESSDAPPHEHKEQHARVGEGTTVVRSPALVAQSGHHGSRSIVTTDQPVPVIKFLK